MTDRMHVGPDQGTGVNRMPLLALIVAVIFWPAGIVLALLSLRHNPRDRALAYAALGVSAVFALSTAVLAWLVVVAAQSSSGKTDADSVQALRAARGDLSVAVVVYEAALAEDPSLARRTGPADVDDLPGLRFSRFTERETLAVEQRDGSFCIEASTTVQYGSRVQHYDSADDRYYGGSCAEPTALTP